MKLCLGKIGQKEVNELGFVNAFVEADKVAFGGEKTPDLRENRRVGSLTKEIEPLAFLVAYHGDVLVVVHLFQKVFALEGRLVLRL